MVLNRPWSYFISTTDSQSVESLVIVLVSRLLDITEWSSVEISITMDQSVLNWPEEKINKGGFASVSIWSGSMKNYRHG